MSDEVWLKDFRMTKTTFAKVVSMVQEDMKSRKNL